MALTALAGCASSGRGEKDSISVLSDPAGAIARLGSQEITTPGRLDLPAKGPVTIRFEKEGCWPVEIVLRRQKRGISGTGDGGDKSGTVTVTSDPGGPNGVLIPVETLARWFRGFTRSVGEEPWPLSVRARLECGSEQRPAATGSSTTATEAGYEPASRPPARASAAASGSSCPRGPGSEDQGGWPCVDR